MKRIALTLIIALLALPAVAMAKTELVVVTDAPPKAMNPHAYSSDANLSYMSNFFDGLLQRPAPDGKLSPALAVKWERLDALTWKFELRKGVKFHNGNAFNAADVKFTFERMKDPQYSKLLNIANSIASIETPDDYTVIFKNVKPVPWFAETMHQNFIVDMESSKGRDDGDYNTKPIGTGAYKLVEWVKGSYVRMAANPDYWEGAPKYQTVDIRPITEEATRFAALAGKHIYVQKPLTLTIAEGRMASDIVRANNRILQIGSQQRSTEQFHRACQLVRNGKIGKVRRIKIGLPSDPSGGNGKLVPVPKHLDYNQWLGSTAKVPYAVDRVHTDGSLRGRPGWLRQNQFTLGMITGWGSHHLDIAHWGMDTENTGPIAVNATASWPGKDSFWDVHGDYNIALTYANGVELEISHKLPNGIRFEGDDGWIWVSRGSYTATKSDPTSNKKASKVLDASNKSWLNSDLSKDDVQLHRSPSWDHHLDWFQAVKEGRSAVTSVETGHRSCSACMVSWIGMKLARPLKWDPDKEIFPDDEQAMRMTKRSMRAPWHL